MRPTSDSDSDVRADDRPPVTDHHADTDGDPSTRSDPWAAAPGQLSADERAAADHQDHVPAQRDPDHDGQLYVGAAYDETTDGTRDETRDGADPTAADEAVHAEAAHAHDEAAHAHHEAALAHDDAAHDTAHDDAATGSTHDDAAHDDAAHDDAAHGSAHDTAAHDTAYDTSHDATHDTATHDDAARDTAQDDAAPAYRADDHADRFDEAAVPTDDTSDHHRPAPVDAAYIEPPVAVPVQVDRDDDAEPATDIDHDGVADVAPTTDLKPGDVPVAPVTAFLTDDVAQDLRHRWREAQLGFVDDPRQVAEDVRNLVSEAIDKVTAALASQRDELTEPSGNDTEQYRVAVQRHRAFFDRLLNL